MPRSLLFETDIFLCRLILCIAILLVIRSGQHPKAALPNCPNSVEKPSRSNSTCVRMRIKDAIRRHHVTLVGTEKLHAPVILHCPICFEPTENFVWKFVPRNALAPIMQASKEVHYESYWSLIKNKLVDVPTRSATNPCVYPKSNDLHITVDDASKLIGTYVCSNTKYPAHPANFIWYHIDQIGSHRTNSKALQLGFLTRLANRVDNLNQLEAIQTRVRQHLENLSMWGDQWVKPFVMTNFISSEDVYVDRCGPVTISQARRCYIGFPVEKPARFDAEDLEMSYNVLREAFEFLASFHDPKGLSGLNRFRAAQTKAKQLGFQIHGNENFSYLPCEFSLFRHLFILTKRFAEFPRAGYYVDVTYDIVCPKLKAMDILYMENISKLGNVSTSLPDLKDWRYLKIERLVMEGERFLRFQCTTTTSSPLVCDGSNQDVLWRSGNDLSFGKKRKPTDNVYVTSACELRFDEVHMYDVDFYYCFLRDTTKTHTVWSAHPRIAYRLQVQQKTFSWPSRNDLLVGLGILIIWSVVLVILWSILSIYDASIRLGAIFEATIKQAGGRNARLKKTYAPFSEDDRVLFFLLMGQTEKKKKKKSK
ncbi:hypothetical protein D915_002407 [Fasciola hepatica]|uniref:Ig-like domain-containing protein n=1 Tax=Fasciola hepatica TaxID=6192 RepID=A0A4E0RW22_FASHE|nr:hypothetical protein D915_002407 [Fasciola hepatica]